MIPLFLLQGCYLLKQGKGQLELRFQQVPLKEAVQAESNPEYRALLQDIPKIKQFAVHHLHLKNSDNYSGYFATEKEGVAFVVTACEKTDLAPYEWWFPIVGSVPYLGFFDRNDASALEKELQDKGYDTWMFAAPAYSSLGWFKDPVTTPMLRQGYFSLADTIIHEMTHGTVYVKSQTDFNEQLASFVGTTGALSYFAENGIYTPEQLDLIRKKQALIAKVARTVGMTIPTLKSLYGSDISKEDMLKQRERIFDQLTDSIVALLPNTPREKWQFNNARVLQYQRYQSDSTVIQDLWDRSGHDWKRFWEVVHEYVDRTFD